MRMATIGSCGRRISKCDLVGEGVSLKTDFEEERGGNPLEALSLHYIVATGWSSRLPDTCYHFICLFVWLSYLFCIIIIVGGIC